MIPANFFIAPLKAVDLNDVIQRSIEINADLISDLVGAQLDKGLDAEGNDLGEYARFAYKDRWRPIDLKLTGNFRMGIVPGTYDKFFEMIVTNDTQKVSISRTKKGEIKAPPMSNTEKAAILTLRYGDAIIDLSDDAIDKTKEYIIDDMIKITEEEMVK